MAFLISLTLAYESPADEASRRSQEVLRALPSSLNVYQKRKIQMKVIEQVYETRTRRKPSKSLTRILRHRKMTR